MNIDYGNIDQITFIIDLMQKYNKNDLFDQEIKIRTKKEKLGE